VFDLPDMHNSCPQRDETVSAPQALELLNSEFTETEARRWASRLMARYRKDKTAMVRAAYVEAYARQPTDEELAAARDFLSTEASNARDDTSATKIFGKKSPTAPSDTASAPPEKPASLEASAKPAGNLSPEAEAVADFCHAIINSNEFLYVD